MCTECGGDSQVENTQMGTSVKSEFREDTFAVIIVSFHEGKKGLGNRESAVPDSDRREKLRC